jgi:benzoyl-CoA reductase/2-hydroxyglutaryl-CoA dehydratase subunit BcrC/BadD/HgdB
MMGLTASRQKGCFNICRSKKKKMFELAAEVKPMHVMDLPQLPDEPEALANWTKMIRTKIEALFEIVGKN